MDLNLVAQDLRPVVPKFRLPLESRYVRYVLNGVLSILPSQTVQGVRIQRRDAVGHGLRVFIPEVRRSRGALLWIHGGGLIIGHPVIDDRFCAETARALGIVVASVRYRLAPNHPYPAAIDDCQTGWDYLVGAASSLGFDAGRVAIGGQSAGGGLAAALVQRVCDTALPHPIAQWLFCPMLDDRTAARRDLDALRHFVWDNRLNAFGWSAYLGTEPGEQTTPSYAVPARREVTKNLPATWIGVGAIDLFFNEDVRYAEQLKAGGVPTTIDVVPGAPHGFERWGAQTETGSAYVRRAREWLERALTVEP